ncbi:hypothetical protein CC1G_13809 [Coprinopsis cinerea okayama7|uniref:Uncharacterized protein n=1 Tax=Coprinopsis cinerea (strain Okayama-7 / 130 / ATCC MYA-4618 / FGSC 9003) TaxID=240176 RepID=D6RKD8_COPC7|nr:hypothetical protein CC1G_13809 [Coprinopsis cinerea okayama7\|eukprot:XP_002912278.1 hypothetical protein CC1G_13809 [Coprinopsis cinerea okayama7\
MPNWIVVDDNDRQVGYSSGWSVLRGSSRQWAEAVHVTSQQGSTATLMFKGTGIIVVGTIPAGSGAQRWSISIDGGSPTIIERQGGPQDVYDDWFFRREGLNPNPIHTVIVSNAGGQLPLHLDKFEFLPPETDTSPAPIYPQTPQAPAPTPPPTPTPTPTPRAPNPTPSTPRVNPNPAPQPTPPLPRPSPNPDDDDPDTDDVETDDDDDSGNSADDDAPAPSPDTTSLATDTRSPSLSSSTRSNTRSVSETRNAGPERATADTMASLSVSRVSRSTASEIVVTVTDSHGVVTTQTHAAALSKGIPVGVVVGVVLGIVFLMTLLTLCIVLLVRRRRRRRKEVTSRAFANPPREDQVNPFRISQFSTIPVSFGKTALQDRDASEHEGVSESANRSNSPFGLSAASPYANSPASSDEKGGYPELTGAPESNDPPPAYQVSQVQLVRSTTMTESTLRTF